MGTLVLAPRTPDGCQAVIEATASRMSVFARGQASLGESPPCLSKLLVPYSLCHSSLV